MEWLIILPIAFIAGVIGGVVGFGAGVIMVPILVWSFGAKAAIPIMAIAATIANGTRVFIWWREIDWRAAFAYSITAVPFAIIGASMYVAINAQAVAITLGVFLILVVPIRYALARIKFKLSRWHLSIVGAVIGLLTGLVASTGPLNAPFFLMVGLTKGAYIATEAIGSIAVYLTKTAVFSIAGITTLENMLRGLAVGGGLMAGAFVSKRIVEKMAPGDFHMVMDIVVLGAGVAMLVSGLYSGA